MEADERRWRLDQITERIIGCVYQVSNVLGAGYLEKIYENALTVELGLNDLRVGQQQKGRSSLQRRSGWGFCR